MQCFFTRIDGYVDCSERLGMEERVREISKRVAEAMFEKSRPVAACKVCGAVSYSADRINAQCGQEVHADQCAGTIVRAARGNDWKQCPTCQGSGETGETQCSECNGAGWDCLRSGCYQRGQERDTCPKLWTRTVEECR